MSVTLYRHVSFDSFSTSIGMNDRHLVCQSHPLGSKEVPANSVTCHFRVHPSILKACLTTDAITTTYLESGRYIGKCIYLFYAPIGYKIASRSSLFKLKRLKEGRPRVIYESPSLTISNPTIKLTKFVAMLILK